MSDIPEDIIKDLFGFAAPSEQQLNAISSWASKSLELQVSIAQAEAYLAGLQKELSLIEQINLPKALLEAGVSEFTLRNGAKIKLKDVIHGGLSKDPEKRQFTFDWFIENGGQENIKDHFEIDYSKGQYADALKLRRLLQEHKVHFNEFESIHTQTLWAFLREKLKEIEENGGELPPFDDMGLYYTKHAIVTPPPKKKVKNED